MWWDQPRPLVVTHSLVRPQNRYLGLFFRNSQCLVLIYCTFCICSLQYLKVIRLNLFLSLHVTGGARYIPGASDERPGFGGDPFTGTVCLKIFHNLNITRDVSSHSSFFFTQAPVVISQGRVQTQVLLQVLQIPSQVSYLRKKLLNFGRLGVNKRRTKPTLLNN